MIQRQRLTRTGSFGDCLLPHLGQAQSVSHISKTDLKEYQNQDRISTTTVGDGHMRLGTTVVELYTLKAIGIEEYSLTEP